LNLFEQPDGKWVDDAEISVDEQQVRAGLPDDVLDTRFHSLQDTE